MPSHIQRTAWLPYSAESLFELINQVESYPNYLPGCIEASTLSRHGNTVLAQMTLSKAGFTRTLTTCNELTAPTRVSMRLVEGPFKTFEGEWCLTPLGPHATKITLSLCFEVGGAWLGSMVKPLFASMDTQLLHAFCEYAKNTLGTPHLSSSPTSSQTSTNG